MIANKLKLNILKSNLLILNPKRNAPLCELSINSKAGTTRSADQAKYLGVILDCNLDFRQQLKSLEIKIARTVGILYILKYLPEVESRIQGSKPRSRTQKKIRGQGLDL